MFQTASGTNVIGILKGQFFGTANDDAIILGAHLDTQGLQQYGVNNDGSGLTALLTLAEDLTGEFFYFLFSHVQQMTHFTSAIAVQWYKI